MTALPTPATLLVEMIFPDQANHYGTLFGGNGLALMAKAAFVAATRRAGGAVVMARSERVDFARPVPVGSILEIEARVVRVGRTSMTVDVEGRAGDACAPAVLHGRFEMVAVDGAGRPRAVDPKSFEGETDDDA